MLAFSLHAPLATPIYPSTPTLEPPSEVVASTFIGGCRANGLRAAYTAFCTQQTACDLCGGSCTPASFPSGMQLPRHAMCFEDGSAPPRHNRVASRLTSSMHRVRSLLADRVKK